MAEILEQARDAEKPSFRGVLVHVMSNGKSFVPLRRCLDLCLLICLVGGGIQFLTLSRVLGKRTKTLGTSTITGPVALILDSLPEGNGLRCMINVYTQQSRNRLTKYASIPLIAFFYSLFYVSYGGPVMQDVRRQLNAPNVLPGFTDREMQPDATPRLYVFSKTDRLTPTTEVLSHIREAKRLGLDVRTEVFENSPHVSHARVDPDRYWSAVANIWKDATRKTAAKL